jgi:hypothetical protein
MKAHRARLRIALLAGAALAAVSGGFAEARESND